MLISYTDRERDNTIKEAAENLIYFANKVNEEYNTKQKKKIVRQVKIVWYDRYDITKDYAISYSYYRFLQNRTRLDTV